MQAQHHDESAIICTQRSQLFHQWKSRGVTIEGGLPQFLSTLRAFEHELHSKICGLVGPLAFDYKLRAAQDSLAVSIIEWPSCL
jgi:hypothetical protein